MNWLQILGPSLLMVIGGIVTWFIKSRVEELRAIEEKLRDDRRKIYEKILDPYISLFSKKDSQTIQEAIRKVSSYDYKKTAFNLFLFGSDEVVKSYNALMKHTWKTNKDGEQNPREMIRLWGCLLLEIRKSLGNKKTNLEELDMLRGIIPDIGSGN